MEKQLFFEPSVGRQKPSTIHNKETSCPFCDENQLEIIIDRNGPIILVENKYQTLRDTYQTVLIEGGGCDSELSVYPKEHLYKLFEFAMEHWKGFIESGKYESVLMFKNHGPLSGGSIAHPHMQIVGLNKVDYSMNIHEEDFKGYIIDSREGVEWNLSSHPRMGFYELNVVISQNGKLEAFADFIQQSVYYFLRLFRFPCKSYNLFFYQIGGSIACKIVPRYVTTPLFVGYSIPQVPTDLEEVVSDIQSNRS
ncbi:DUF4931 domain-containing protein [Peribacillus alkalitolerans]|uniref:DUF4931 domain-containing protein n=1 Tax=Peribacillus alkalitolerans TaxID=1550385 RepID=UPI0013CFDFC2|nr:DUF4931 domain-containing protein [Peribacillus alkalitolerans]